MPAQAELQVRINSLLSDFRLGYTGITQLTVGATIIQPVGAFPVMLVLPKKIETIINVDLARRFFPILTQLFNDFESDPQLNQQSLYPVLLKKYLGIDLGSANSDGEKVNITCNEEPGAFLSRPDHNSPDIYLHLYFLSPHLAFDIYENMRSNALMTSLADYRLWYWGNPSNVTNVSPLFRKMIQALILCRILDNQQSQEKALPLFQRYISDFERLKDQLIKDIEQGLNAVGNAFFNVPQGYTASRINYGQSDFEPTATLPGFAKKYLEGMEAEFLNIAKFYTFGRHFRARMLVDPHEADTIARLFSQRGNPNYGVKWFVYWMVSHLNLSTSIFLSKLVINKFKALYAEFCAYVLMPQRTHDMLFESALRFFGLAFLVLLSPVLLFGPAIFGVTSMPFSILRSLMLHSRHTFFHHKYNFYLLEFFEHIKDFAILFGLMWFLSAPILLAFKMVLPVWLLTAATYTSHVFSVFFVKNRRYRAPFGFRNSWKLAEKPLSSLFGLAALSVGVYYASGVVLKAVAAFFPNMVYRVLNIISLPFSWLTNKIEKLFDLFSVDSIYTYPRYDNTQSNILIPRQQMNPISEEILKEVDQLRNALGLLNQSFHFGIQRKEVIKNCLQSLEIRPQTTETDLESGIYQAKCILANNFAASEISLISDLISRLENAQSQQDPIITKERQGIRQSQGLKGQYQPSLLFLQKLRDKKIINSDGDWVDEGNDTETLQSIANKSRRIEASLSPV